MIYPSNGVTPFGVGAIDVVHHVANLPCVCICSGEGYTRDLQMNEGRFMSCGVCPYDFQYLKWWSQISEMMIAINLSLEQYRERTWRLNLQRWKLISQENNVWMRSNSRFLEIMNVLSTMVVLSLFFFPGGWSFWIGVILEGWPWQISEGWVLGDRSTWVSSIQFFLCTIRMYMHWGVLSFNATKFYLTLRG